MPTNTSPISFLTPNTAPASISFKRTVTLSTLDQNNNNASLAEGYVVSGPVSQGVTPIFIAGGTKAVIPLSTSSGNGAPYLKIHFPTGSGDKLYLTYAVGNSQMADGYYDYKTGVPTSYYNALRAWINALPPFATTGTLVKTRSLKFSAYGNATNKPANAVTFYLTFQGTFGASVSNNSNIPNNDTQTS